MIRVTRNWAPPALLAPAFLAMVASAPPALAQPTASFRSLGALTTDDTDLIVASGMSADGRVIVGNEFTANGARAFRWTLAGGMQPLGAFANPGSAQYSAAYAASADGSVVVGGSTLPTSLNEQGSPFRWTQSTGLVFLGNLGGTDGGLARAVSADGSVIVGTATNSDFLGEVFRWTQPGGMIGLGGHVDGTFVSDGTGVSSDGNTLVGASSSGFNHIAFRWTQPDGLLFVSPGGLFPSAISGDGTTIVGSQGGVLTTAFFLRDNLITPIPRLTITGDNDSDAALAVSADGSVIVGFANRALDSNVSERAFIWDAVNGTRSIQTILTDQYGIDLTGWTLQEATAISADGKTIAGWGYGPPGQTRQLSWIVQFGDASITGRCCTNAGACTIAPITSCLGTWTSGETCGTACPVVADPTGPCCSGGACTLSTRAACTGDWALGGPCEPNPCQPPVPMGTCCNTFSTDCNVTTSDSCFGDWTVDATCTPTTCPGPMGACCSTTNACTAGNQGTCLAPSTFHAFASCDSNPCAPPPPSGACCQSTTSCAVRTQAGCPTNRVWIQGATCSPSPCSTAGACCAPSGACISVAPPSCTGSNTFRGGSCSPTPCPQPNHVCCRGATCMVLADSMCIGDSFSPARINTNTLASCSAATSAADGCCAADYNQGGFVSVQDIFDFLNAWFAGSPFADAGGSGALDVGDIFSFLNAWFAGCS